MRILIKLALTSVALTLAAAPALAADTAMAPKPAMAAKPGYTTQETDVGTLIDTPATRAIIDKILPDFAKNDQIDMARPMTFRAIQQFVPDKLTDAKLNELDAEFAKLTAPAAK